MTDIRKETDSLGEVDVPADKLWGAQTQRSLEHALLLQPVVQYYANVGGGAHRAVVFGFRTKVEF
jgi:aspartate ammonia-lyase